MRHQADHPPHALAKVPPAEACLNRVLDQPHERAPAVQGADVSATHDDHFLTETVARILDEEEESMRKDGEQWIISPGTRVAVHYLHEDHKRIPLILKVGEASTPALLLSPAMRP